MQHLSSILACLLLMLMLLRSASSENSCMEGTFNVTIESNRNPTVFGLKQFITCRITSGPKHCITEVTLKRPDSSQSDYSCGNNTKEVIGGVNEQIMCDKYSGIIKFETQNMTKDFTGLWKCVTNHSLEEMRLESLGTFIFEEEPPKRYMAIGEHKAFRCQLNSDKRRSGFFVWKTKRGPRANWEFLDSSSVEQNWQFGELCNGAEHCLTSTYQINLTATDVGLVVSCSYEETDVGVNIIRTSKAAIVGEAPELVNWDDNPVYYGRLNSTVDIKLTMKAYPRPDKINCHPDGVEVKDIIEYKPEAFGRIYAYLMSKFVEHTRREQRYTCDIGNGIGKVTIKFKVVPLDTLQMTEDSQQEMSTKGDFKKYTCSIEKFQKIRSTLRWFKRAKNKETWERLPDEIATTSEEKIRHKTKVIKLETRIQFAVNWSDDGLEIKCVYSENGELVEDIISRPLVVHCFLDPPAAPRVIGKSAVSATMMWQHDNNISTIPGVTYSLMHRQRYLANQKWATVPLSYLKESKEHISKVSYLRPGKRYEMALGLNADCHKGDALLSSPVWVDLTVIPTPRIIIDFDDKENIVTLKWTQVPPETSVEIKLCLLWGKEETCQYKYITDLSTHFMELTVTSASVHYLKFTLKHSGDEVFSKDRFLIPGKYEATAGDISFVWFILGVFVGLFVALQCAMSIKCLFHVRTPKKKDDIKIEHITYTASLLRQKRNQGSYATTTRCSTIR